ncbi:MAG: dinitrogenase iron-molybdenum cofactor biosynthesis protein [Treponema sp.]|nr:dinitrogenase iron-molybdenum cofactor biosynthesis protein [Treponema sp.]
MAWRVAVSSVDDVLINQHFGRARWFYIRDLERDGTSRSLGRRAVSPLCGGCENGEGGAGGGGESGLEALGDCAAVLTAKIGPHVRGELERAGISVFEEPAVIEEALQKLAAYYVRTRRPENA